MATPDPGQDVLIVGAGPTGLVAAACLIESGLRVTILDKEPSAAKESRAFAVQARTLEILLRLGLADAFLDRGTLASGAEVYVNGRSAAGFGFELPGRTDAPFPLILTLPQSETEAILVDHLASRGVSVRRGVVATALSQDGAGVTLRVREGDGGERELRSGYLIGADGAHSLVRKALGLRFEGGPYAQTFLLADCHAEGMPDDGPFAVFFHGTHFAMWFPLKGERSGRVISTSRQAIADASVAGQGSAPATLPEVEAAFREAANLPVRLSDATWLSRYRVHHRGVDRYAVGRVFVAGDAAHIHSPAGGQGMNTGIQDAANLAWKIAAVVGCGAPETLLGSYDAERRPVGEGVLKATDRMFTLATGGSAWASAARNVLLPLVVGTVGRSEFARSRAFDFLSELGIFYGPSSASVEAPEEAHWPGGPAPGHRAPDAAIGRKRSVFDLLAGYRFDLLAFSRTPLTAGDIERLSGEFDSLVEEAPVRLEAHLVGHSRVGRLPRLHQVENDAVLAAYGITRDVGQGLYLVRPDGYVAWRAPSLDLGPLRAVLAERFSRRSVPSAS